MNYFDESKLEYDTLSLKVKKKNIRSYVGDYSDIPNSTALRNHNLSPFTAQQSRADNIYTQMN
jgi:hypothetical protein